VGTVKNLHRVAWRGAVHAGQCSPVNLKPGDRLNDVVICDIHRRVNHVCLSQDVSKSGEPLVSGQNRPREVSRLEGPSQNGEGFRDVEAVLGLPHAPKRHISQPNVVIKPGVGGIDNDLLVHRILRWGVETCWKKTPATLQTSQMKRGWHAVVAFPLPSTLTGATLSPDIERALDVLSGGVFTALTGAGVSTDSGIPDYRGEGAPRNHPMSYREFLSSHARRQRYWFGSHLGWRNFAAASPNPGHTALASAEALGLSHGVITQNVDGLHHQAGSRRVVDLHGRLDRVRCIHCGQSYSREAIAHQIAENNPGLATHSGVVKPDGDVAAEVPADFVVPDCDLCGGVVKPEVVFFGEFVPPAVFGHAENLLRDADALVVAGSSLVVNTGMRLVDRAVRKKKPVVVINRGPTKADTVATVRIEAGTSDALTALVAHLA
jgi:NAD-dependent SIR2 family protein deacetylase